VGDMAASIDRCACVACKTCSSAWHGVLRPLMHGACALSTYELIVAAEVALTAHANGE
jgi:hypothetical protein